MESERPDFTTESSLDGLRTELTLAGTKSVIIGARGTFSHLDYELAFVSNRPRGDYLRISTPRRQDFLSHDTEGRVQIFLANLTKAVKDVTGGAVEIHPYYGAIYGNGIAPLFAVPDTEPNRRLSMTLFLTDYVSSLDFSPPPPTQEVGTIIPIWSLRAERESKYFEQARNANPNQKNRDRSFAIGTSEAWDKEFKRFNSPSLRLPYAMPIGPNNIADLMGSLVKRGLVENVRLKKVPEARDFRTIRPIAILLGG